MGSRAADLARAHGFSLQSVCWGYRELFAKTLQELVDAGSIGADRPQATTGVFAMLREADRSSYDHVLKEFLVALNPTTRWLLDLPGVFGSVVEVGRRLAGQRIHLGTAFFELLGSGSLGRTPAEMRTCVAGCHRLLETDAELALAFARGFPTLRDRLRDNEIDRFVSEGLRLVRASREARIDYFACRSKAAQSIIRSITREARLEDVEGRLSALARALVGREVGFPNLGGLDADELIERGATFVCLAGHAYVPDSVRLFEAVETNAAWYRLLALVACASLRVDSFPVVHGAPGASSVVELTAGDTLRANLVTVIEYARIVDSIRSVWPGARRLVSLGIATDLEGAPGEIRGRGAPWHALLAHMLADRPPDAAENRIGVLLAIARESVNVADTAERLTAELAEAFADLGARPMAPIRFLPDFFYDAELADAPPSTVADLHEEAEQRRRRDGEDVDADGALTTGQDGDGEPEGEESESERVAAYLYDEWDQARGEYHEAYCRLFEHVPSPGESRALSSRIEEQARRVRRAFELVRPQLAHKEKYLDEGVEINVDLLHEYLIDSRREPSPRVRFYERPRITERDLAVVVLLDASGSTSGNHGATTILDLEKEATVILGEALDSLGDRFEVGGFATRGPEHCDYAVYKSIAEPWSSTVVARLGATRPANSTRMGVALRHAGWRLSRVTARQRLILVITDGRPMDEHYSPDTRYAQYDVRAACEENERRSIHTFAISTEENSPADMELMFPRRRFSILHSMSDLPRVLPRLYAHLTIR